MSLFFSFLRGWLPRNPLDYRADLGLAGPGASFWLLHMNRIVRYGAASGLVWAAIVLFNQAGYGYLELPRAFNNFYYLLLNVLNIPVLLSLYSTFHTRRRRLALTGTVIGIASGMIMVANYLYIETLLDVLKSPQEIIGQLAKAGYFDAVYFASDLLIGLSMVVFASVVAGRFLRAFSVIGGAISVAGIVLGKVIYVYLGGLGLPLWLGDCSGPPGCWYIPGTASALPLYISIIWIILLGTGFLYLGRAIGWRLGLTIVIVGVVTEYLVLTGVLWLPDVRAGDFTFGFMNF